MSGQGQSFYQNTVTSAPFDFFDYDVDVAADGDNFIFGDNILDETLNFHGDIRLLKTSHTGDIIWAKRYEAEEGKSIHILEIKNTSDGNFIASGFISADNDAINSEKMIFKFDNSGNILWANKYTSMFAYNEKSIVQMPDSGYVFALSTFSDLTNHPVLCKIDADGNVVKVLQFNAIDGPCQNITVHGNSLDIVLAQQYIVNTDLDLNSINWQRHYITPSLTPLLSGRCANGDLIYASQRVAGGTGEGEARMFRTDSLGSLKWAKNIKSWGGDSSQFDPLTVFDMVGQAAVLEDINKNIVGVLAHENGQLLFVVFDSLGNYLTNRYYDGGGFNNGLKYLSNGSFVIGTVSAGNPSSTQSCFPLASLSTCDSVYSVLITNGNDSAGATPAISTSMETITNTSLTFTSFPLSVTPVSFCSPVTGIQEPGNNHLYDYKVYPNPVADKLNISLSASLNQTKHITIHNSLGQCVMAFDAKENQITIPVRSLKMGIYLLTVSDEKGTIIRTKFSKE